MTLVVSLLLMKAAMPLITSGSAATYPPIQVIRSGDFRDPPISLNAQGGIVDIAAGEKSGDDSVAVDKLGFVSGDEIEPHLYFEAPARFLAFNLGDGLLEQLQYRSK